MNHYSVLVIIFLTSTIMLTQAWADSPTIKSIPVKVTPAPVKEVTPIPANETKIPVKVVTTKDSFKIKKSDDVLSQKLVISGNTDITQPFILELIDKKGNNTLNVPILPFRNGTFFATIIGELSSFNEMASDNLQSFGCGSSRTLPDGSTISIMCVTRPNVLLDKGAYCPNEEILVRGSVPAVEGPTPVTLAVIDQNRGEYYSTSFETQGPFTKSVVLDESVPSGEYAMKATFLGRPGQEARFHLFPMEQCSNSDMLAEGESQESESEMMGRIIEENEIPSWVKDIARYWHNGVTSDVNFADAIGYLIEVGKINAPQVEAGSSDSRDIPLWVKSNAGWWADGQINDSDFMNAIEYLIKRGIIRV
jgi:hypothetical protein